MFKPRFYRRKVEIDGKRGVVAMEYGCGDEWHSAMILFDDDYLRVEVIRSLEELQDVLLPVDDDFIPKEEMGSSQDNSTTKQKAPEAVRKPDIMETDETRQSSQPPAVERSAIKSIALPRYGTSDEAYMQGPTGKWYSKKLAFKLGDKRLRKWIDDFYPQGSVWDIDCIADERTAEGGTKEYLVKFLGFEVNPGVCDEPSNPGDWYGEHEIVDRRFIREFNKKLKPNAATLPTSLL